MLSVILEIMNLPTLNGGSMTLHIGYLYMISQHIFKVNINYIDLKSLENPEK